LTEQPLDGARICVLVDHKFIPEEIDGYLKEFPKYGAEVDLVARIWWGDHKPASQEFLGDVDPLDSSAWESKPKTIRVSKDISTVGLNEYAAVLVSANYTSVRMRWDDVPQQPPWLVDARAYVQMPPAVRLFSDAMRNTNIVKGALCHGLWLLTAHRDLMEGRAVTCHTVVMADVLNAGARVQFAQDDQKRTVVAPVVVDRSAKYGCLVTGYSKEQLTPYIHAVAEAIGKVRTGGHLK
jgi:protease I